MKENTIQSKYIPAQTCRLITNETTEEEIRSWNPVYYDFMKEYHIQHAVCPNCGSKHYSQTLVGYLFDSNHPERYADKNAVNCIDCGWKGTVHDLVKEFNK